MKKDIKMIGTPAKANRILKVVVALLAIYAVLRLLVLNNIFSGFADVVAAVMIALICGYFAGKTRNDQREQEAEEADEEMLAEAPVLAEPVATTPTAEPVPATEPVAPVAKSVATTPVVDYDSLKPDDLEALERAEKYRKLRLIKLGMERESFNADDAKLNDVMAEQARLLAEGEKAVKK